MKCFKHNLSDALAVCAYCGRGVCRECARNAEAVRIVCSAECEMALARDARAVQTLLDKSTQTAKASAFYCYLTGGLSAGAAVGAWFMLPSPFLIYFTAACAVALCAAGFWYSGAAKRRHPN